MTHWVLRVLLPDPPLKREMTVDHWRAYYDRADDALTTSDDPNEEPPHDDTVHCCPDCERPNQFGELCPSCQHDRKIEIYERD